MATSPTPLFSLLLFSFPLLFLLPHSAARSPDSDLLLSFKSSADESNTLVTWASDTDPCSSSTPWYGVSCFHNRVSKIVLEDLSLTGSFHPLSSLTGLRVLSLAGNHLSGPIPDLSNLTSLKLLFLSHNSLSGRLPDSLPALSRLDLSFNRLSGQIPANFNALDRLLTLRLEENALSGPISHLRLPNILDFNVSGNNFQGEISTSLSGFPSSSFSGNPGLCGPPLPPCEPGPTSPPRPGPPANHTASGFNKIERHGGARISSSAIIGVVIGDFAILAVISLLLFCFFWRSYALQRISSESKAFENAPAYANNAPAGVRGKMVFFDGGEKFELEELLRASAEVLGKGASGTAYKATLDDGRVVAVKRLKMDVAASAAGGEFERRMEVAGRVRHPNVAELRAYYLAKEEKLVVLDYMPNGSLFCLLHGNRGPGRTPLDWTTRLKIAAGASRGLAHIHSLNLTHANIKSTNVLIDNSGDARVSDFAFPSPLASCKGNLGYRAPELVHGARRVSKKADVYSFGVLLLELITGKCPGTGAEGADLRGWVETVIKEEWTAEVFDVELMRYKDIQDELVGFLHIGLSCTSPSPDQRPTMAQVAKLIDDLRGGHALVSSDGA